jgi:hypothetical protein
VEDPRRAVGDVQGLDVQYGRHQRRAASPGATPR